MAFFGGRSIYGQDATFAPLFRLLDDFETYSRDASGQQNNRTHTRQARNRVISPRFDIRETDTAYDLYGEVPGIDKKDLSIEFTEPQTMVIRGRVERTYSAGTPPAAAVEDQQTGAAITESGEATPPHQASVSDVETEAAKESGDASASKETKDAAPVAAAPKPKEHFWQQERSVGEFHRTFTFPSRVDDSEVSANLNNGILHVVVPKATNRESRRITVD